MALFLRCLNRKYTRALFIQGVLSLYIETNPLMFTLLSDAKKFLNIDPEIKEDDELILMLIQAAEDAVERDLNRPLSKLVNPTTGMLPYSVKCAISLLIGSLYADREATTHSKITDNPTFRYLVDMSRKIVTL